MNVLFRRFEIFIVTSIVFMDIETHLHFNVAKEAGMSLVSFVVIPHNSNFISDIRESHTQKSVE